MDSTRSPIHGLNITTSNTVRRDVVAAVLFLALVVFLRLGSFRHVVLDPDEGLYVLMAQNLLAGGTPYVDVWDHKPPGIYFLFAAAQLLIGPSIVSIRLLTCLAVTASSYLIFRFGRDVLGSAPVGCAAGIVYAAFSLANGGLAANTELFFAPFVIAGFCALGAANTRAVAADCHTNRTMLLVAGVCFGMALQIKYVAAFELLAVPFLLTVSQMASSKRALGRIYALVVLGTVTPAAALFVFFVAQGHAAEYWYANTVANLVHINDTDLGHKEFARAARALNEYAPLWLISTAAVPLLLLYWRRQPRVRREVAIVSVWLVAALAGVTATKRFYPHYFLQVLPPLSVLSAYVSWYSVRLLSPQGGTSTTLPFALMLCLALFRPLAQPVRESARAAWGRDLSTRSDVTVRQVATYLNNRMRPSDCLYVANYYAVLYQLVDACRVTKYLFPNFLTTSHFARVAGVDPVLELERIMTEGRPKYVVVVEEPMDDTFAQPLHEYLSRLYRAEVHIANVAIYGRIAAD
jgi:4-amino-4-deoxy-L-arabinose transferase-like glycosyltransferase